MAKLAVPRMIVKLFTPVFILALTSCTLETFPYDSSLEGELLNSPPIQINGKGLIWTTVEEDEFVSDRYRIGEITREISVDVFSQIFADGAEHSNFLPESIQYSAVVTPIVKDISYIIEDRSNFLQFIFYQTVLRPQIQLELHVHVTRQTGEVLLDKTYSRGPVIGEETLSAIELRDQISRMTYELITEILNQAAADTYDIFKHRQLDMSLGYER